MDCPNGPFPKPPAPLPGLPLGVTPSKASAKLPPFYLPTKFFTRFFAEKYVKKHTLLTCRCKPGGYKLTNGRQSTTVDGWLWLIHPNNLDAPPHWSMVMPNVCVAMTRSKGIYKSEYGVVT